MESLRERLDFLPAPDLPGVTCMWAENCSTHFLYFHETYTITAMQEGHGAYLTEGRRFEVHPQDIHLWEPGDTHRVVDIQGGRFGFRTTTQRAFFFDPDVIDRAARDLGAWRSTPHVRSHDRQSSHTFQAVSRLADSLQRPATPIERESNLALLLRSMLENVLSGTTIQDSQAPEELAILRAREYLIEESARNVSLQDLVRVTGLDQFRLLRAFKRQVGLTPHVFLVQVRVMKARRLLRKRVPASVTAAAAGFSDQSHMIRCFRQSIGITPSRFCPGS
jgi:AraC-like DNA-binding protein